MDYILVPIGGGGLATGVSTLAKLLNPHIKVIGVEPAGAACMKASLKKGEVVTLPHVNTIADGTAVQTPGKKIFPYIQKNLDDIITIEDDELIVAFLDMVENHKMIVENSSDCGCASSSGCEGEEDCFYPEWWKYGCDHDVFCCAAWSDPEGQNLYGFCSDSG